MPHVPWPAARVGRLLLLTHAWLQASSTPGLDERYLQCDEAPSHLGKGLVDRSCLPAYWGIGWEDPVYKAQVYKALPVAVDGVSALSVDVVDDMDWLAFEAGQLTANNLGYTRVIGAEGFVPQPLQSWTARHDAVQHGYFMLYRMDKAVTELARDSMEDYTFSITLDVHEHPEYAASVPAQGSNSSVRFTVYESLPADLSRPDVQLNMVNDAAKHTVVLTGGDDVDSRSHRLMWGLGNGGSGALTGNCTAPVTELYFGVQCLRGFGVPAGACTPNVMSAPTLDDCKAYCPFTLTVRAIPRLLRHGDEVPTMLGPGQWQVFELDAGPYDLLEVTVERSEYDNVNVGYAWQDGLSGDAWLSKGSCIRNVSTFELDHNGYCPHGGGVTHRFCSGARNWSVEVTPPDAHSYVRHARIQPSHGELDDLGYSQLLAQIRQKELELEASMHYPTQLLIRASIAALHRQAGNLSMANSVWRRRWPMRLCTTDADAGRYFLTIYANDMMDSSPSHSGRFLVRYLNEAFDRSALLDGVGRRGCLQRGGTERFMIASSPLFPERTSLGLAEVRSYHVTGSASNHVSTMVMRRAEPPTRYLYDTRVVHPNLRTSMSACDVSQPQVWHLAIDLDGNAQPSEVFFEVVATLEDSTLSLGSAVSGFVCCGQYKYYAFPHVEEKVAPSVDFNLTTGRIKALYWRHDACPRESEHVDNGRCRGWCVLEWYRLYSVNLGVSQYLSSSTLSVPYGMGEQPDKRRGGRWYLGIQALDGPAEYQFLTSETAPRAAVDTISRLDRYWPTADRYRSVFTSSARARSGAEQRHASAIGAASAASATLVLLAMIRPWRT